MYLTTRRLYVSADNRLCEGHDPEVMYLLAPAGVMLPEETVQRYKLREVDAAREAESEPSEPETDEDEPGETDEDETGETEAAAPKRRSSKSRAS